MQNKNSEMNLEDAMKRLEKIVEILETGDKTLEESIELFEEGMKLSNMCYKLLESLEERIKVVMKKESGDYEIENFKE